MTEKLGASGSIAKLFQSNPITPLLALIAVLLGLFAVLVTPREEEPQIDVTFANIFIAYPGASATEVEQLIATPAEQVLSELSGLEHVYSVSKPGMAVLTTQFEVGEQRTDAIVRLYNQIYSNSDWLPAQLGVAQPIIKPKGIDDVPIVTLTLWQRDKQDAYALKQVAHAMESELKRVAGTRDIYTVGGPDNVVRIELDARKLAAYDIDINQLSAALKAANQSAEAGVTIKANQATSIQAGQFLTTVAEVQSTVVGVHNGHPVYLIDVANVMQGPEQPDNYLWFGQGAASPDYPLQSASEHDAVTLAIAKQPGHNAVDIADAVTAHIAQLRGVVIPDNVEVTVTRNYGQTANDKAQKLIQELISATVAVVLLILISLGWREALIVGVAVIVTLLLMLFASWAWGFTINRVSLFALIFSIGILVDDAIVVVENVHRHIQQGGKTLAEAIPVAVNEVGGPTILATLAVIAALLPMAFVSGLMGPYMSPIPINASIGMLLSLLVAFILTPWMSLKLLGNKHVAQVDNTEQQQGMFYRVLSPFVYGDKAKLKRRFLALFILLLIAASVALPVTQQVILKMLPFDNKSEIQLVIDMPEGTPLEQTAAVTRALTAYIKDVPEVIDYQAYVGLASPINFNGLVRQYYLREGQNVADIQINLQAKSLRERSSHEIATAIRAPLQQIAAAWQANVKVVEVPPGPPVQAPVVAEVYGLDYPAQQAQATALMDVLSGVDGIVDIDSSVEADAPRKQIIVDQQKAALFGLSQQQIVTAIRLALDGEDVGYLHNTPVKYAVPLRLQLPIADQADLDSVLQLELINQQGDWISLGDVVKVIDVPHQQTIYHKDLLPVVFVTADMAGELDSPLYGMFAAVGQLRDSDVDQFYIAAPELPVKDSIKWDGEWQITYETFRDMGIAYAVGIVLIYLLIVAQFKSYFLPLIIMIPIPLTIIGVMPGHALLGAQFTATSMIGMIAMAGIIVRNSILLVDFIRDALDRGVAVEQAVIQAASIRAKPIMLTAVSAMLGAVFILEDPIFNGLAVSLIFGIFVATILTLLVIPLMFYAFIRSRADS